MKSRPASIFLAVLLVFSQLSAALGLSNGLAWCQHTDGQISVESAIELAECHAKQAEASDGDTLKSCVDVPFGSEKLSQHLRSGYGRELAALQAASIVVALPFFETDFLFLSKPSVRPVADADDPSRDVVLDSLSTVILLT